MEPTDEMIEAAKREHWRMFDNSGPADDTWYSSLRAALTVAPAKGGEDDKDLLAIVQDAMRESWTDEDEYANAPFFIVDAILHEGFRRLPVPDTERSEP